ncbi:ROK family protein [Persicobacter diffluens]|uniref:Glucokinase n=1 Tax=Persicobacter diffluens TaxID=981 RepID=A0AAN4W2F4_9BACT|nr:glucokinase [Persicobacter diffluens]
MSRVVAVDMGGTLIKLSIINNNQLVREKVYPANAQGDFDGVMAQLEQQLYQLIQADGWEVKDLLGMGISIPGIVDIRQNRVLSINQKHVGATDFDFNQWARKIGLASIVLDNDARAALVGEQQFGAGKGYEHVNMITLGTGIGGAAMIHGQLLYGKHYQAGCLGGHFSINFKGAHCNCGNIGCVETEGASWSLPRLIKSHPQFADSTLASAELLDFYHLFHAYRQGDTVAKMVAHHCLDAWAAGIINMIHAYDPEVVVVGGGVMKSGDIILPYLQNRIKQLAWTPCAPVKVVTAALGSMAGCLGINHLLQQKHQLANV